MGLWIDRDFKQWHKNILQHLLEILHKILGSKDITAQNTKHNQSEWAMNYSAGGLQYNADRKRMISTIIFKEANSQKDVA